MKISVTQSVNNVSIVQEVQTKLEITPFDTGYGAVLLSAINAKGDLLVGTGNGVLSRLAVGSNGQVLSADSSQITGLAWVPQTGGSSFAATNRDATQHDIGTVVMQDLTNDTSMIRTTASQDRRVMAIAIENVGASASGLYAQTGKLTVLVQGNVAKGQWLIPSSTIGRASAYSLSTKPAYGAIGIATTDYSGGGAGSVTAIVDIDLQYQSALTQLATTSTYGGAGSGTSHTKAHTTDAGTTLLVVRLAKGATGGWSSVTFNGVGMTLAYDPGISANCHLAFYYMVNPPIGTYNIVVSFAAADYITMCATNYKGTKASPFRSGVSSYNASGISVSLSPPSAVGDIIIDIHHSTVGGWTVTGSGQAQEYYGTANGRALYYSKAPGAAGTTTVGFGGASSTYLGYAAIAIMGP